LGWREQFETVAGGRRTVELLVQLPPSATLGALREHFVASGSFGVTEDAEGVLEVEDRSGAGGCMSWVVIGLVVALFTFGVGLVLVVLWAFTKFRRWRAEAVPSGSGATRLTISGYPQQTVTEAEQWVRANLPVERVGG
jgi:hypothetical protein